ncbi:MAG: DUF5693 family protein [Elusimicrobiota bacterium]
MDILQNKKARYAVYALIAVISVWTAWKFVNRVIAENSNRSVEICIDLNQAADLCQANGYPLNDFLARCQAAGASSAALHEETPASLAASRKIIYFSAADFSRLKILDLIPYGSEVKPGSLLVPDKDLAAQISSQLTDRYSLAVEQRRVGKYRVLTPEFASGYIPAYWNENTPLGFSSEEIEYVTKLGLKAVLRPVNSGNPQWLDIPYGEDVSGFVWEGKEVPGYSGREDMLCAALSKNGLKFVNLEFNYPAGNEKLNSRLPSQAVRGHSIQQQELNRSFSADFWTARWERAVKERGIRFLLFYFWNGKSVDDNISYLRGLAHRLKGSSYRLETARPPRYPARAYNKIWIFFTAAAGILFPLIGLFAAKKQENPFKAFLICNGLTLSGALLISAFLFDVTLMQKIRDIPGIKAIMLLPMAASFFILYPPQQINKILSFKIQLKHVLLVFAAFLGIVILLLRTGNYNLLTSQPEYFFRDFLENIFGFRPRTKEFLIGQPLLFIGFAFKRPWLVLIGMIGQVSIINTFLHAHSPAAGSLARSIHGIWIGLLIGYLVSTAIRKISDNRRAR